MSLLNILQNFINKTDKDEDETSLINQLDYILDEYYQNNLDIEELDEYSSIDNIIYKLRSTFYTDDLDSIELPKLYNLVLYNDDIIKRWIEIDKMEAPEYKMICNACRQNYDNTYIMYLLDLGFNTSIYDTLYLAENQQFNLLIHYCKNGFPYNQFAANEVIRHGRLDILDWLFTNNMIEKSNYEYLIDSAFMFNDIFIVDYLMKYHNIKPIYNIYERLYSEFINNKINNVMLSWLWGNNIKWTKEEALVFNNSFMMSFYSNDMF